jgi:dephospho-CoA kinase
MLKVGLTGGLGSGKSTVASMLRALGAHVIETDELGRSMMEPGQAVYAAIVEHFGAPVVGATGRLDRARLAKLAFSEGRLEELNAIVHPPVIAAQQQWMEEIFRRDPRAVAVVESALLFEVERDARARGEREGALAEWRRRIDRVIVVTAAEDVKIARYVTRTQASGQKPAARSEELETEARRRIARQIPDAEKAAQADYVIDNSGDIAHLHAQVEALWPRLQAESNKSRANLSLQ